MVNVLFLCTHNSARSVIAEVLLNTLGKGKFTGFSAGSSPKTDVNPIAREIAEEMRYDCLLYTSPSPRDRTRSRMPSSA